MAPAKGLSFIFSLLSDLFLVTLIDNSIPIRLLVYIIILLRVITLFINTVTKKLAAEQLSEMYDYCLALLISYF